MWGREMNRFFNLKTESIQKALRLSAALFLVISSGVSFMPVCAENEDEGTGDATVYGEHEIDPFTGEAVYEYSTATTDVTVASNVTYQPDSNAFQYLFGGNSDMVVRSTVADGMYTNAAVTIECSSTLSVQLYRNGHTDSQDLSNITLPGSYVLTVSRGSGQDMYTLSFRIIDVYTNAQGFEAPEGFNILTVKKDQKKQTFKNNYVSMDEEGIYIVSYVCQASNVVYSFQATVDHTAPVLKLEAVNENGIATSEVDLSDCEEDAVMYIDQDGDRISSCDVLKVPGYYEITVQDPAGNTSHYAFTIRMYFTHSLWVVVIILIGSLAGLGAYVFLSRRNLRVR